MKYIIVGLGNFGASLAVKLTKQGNEVIGIDSAMNKVDSIKEQIAYTICLDATDQQTVQGLPLKDTDVVVISIGKDQGANIMATAVFKNLKVKKIISRAINSLHEKVLEAIGVDEIVHPEKETAERWAKKLSLKNIVDSFELNEDYSIIEAETPEDYIGKSILDVGFRSHFNLLVLTIIKQKEVKSLLGKQRTEMEVTGVVKPDKILQKKDILVLYGANKDIENFLRQEVSDH